MLSRFARFAAPCAAIALSACAGGSASLRREVDGLRGEVTALKAQNDAMARRLDSMWKTLDAAAERLPRQQPAPTPAPAAAEHTPSPARPLVPANLAVVRVEPPEPLVLRAPPEPVVLRAPPARAARVPPPLSTAVEVAEPDPDWLDELERPTGRELAAEAEVELAEARRRNGVDRAHALESFVSRYPRHPSADNALVEGARDYADAGRVEASCELARRVPEDYPAGDAVSAAQQIVARCERSRP